MPKAADQNPSGTHSKRPKTGTAMKTPTRTEKVHEALRQAIIERLVQAV